MAIENVTQILNLIPQELASKITFVIQALGGLFFIYIILIVIRIYLMKKEFAMIKEMKKDIEFIKRKLKAKK